MFIAKFTNEFSIFAAIESAVEAANVAKHK